MTASNYQRDVEIFIKLLRGQKTIEVSKEFNISVERVRTIENRIRLGVSHRQFDHIIPRDPNINYSAIRSIRRQHIDWWLARCAAWLNWKTQSHVRIDVRNTCESNANERQ